MQRALVDSTAHSLEVGRDSGWAKWGRTPDVATALSVLGRGTFALPRHVFAAGEPSAPSGLSLEQASARRQRAAQLTVMTEHSLPAGAVATTLRSGLVELAVPGLFAAFLALQPGGWRVRAVELLVAPRGAPPPFTERELAGFAAMANEAVQGEQLAGKEDSRPLAAACATLGAMAGRCGLALLEAQSRKLAAEWPMLLVEQLAEGAELCLRPWGGATPAVRVTSARRGDGPHAITAALVLQDGSSAPLSLAPAALSAVEILVTAATGAADRTLAALAALLGCALRGLEGRWALPPRLLEVRARHASVEVRVRGATALAAAVDLRTGRVHGRSAADPAVARQLELCWGARAGNRALLAEALLLAAARGGALLSLGAAARAHPGLAPHAGVTAGLSVATPAATVSSVASASWALVAQPMLVRDGVGDGACAAVLLEASFAAAEPSFAVIVAAHSAGRALGPAGQRPLELLRVPVPTPEFVVPAAKRRRRLELPEHAHAAQLSYAVAAAEALAPLLALVLALGAGDGGGAGDGRALCLPDGETRVSAAALAQMASGGRKRWGLVLRLRDAPPVAISAAQSGGLQFSIQRTGEGPGPAAAGVDVELSLPLIRGGAVVVASVGSGALTVATPGSVDPTQAVDVAMEARRLWIAEGDAAEFTRGLNRFLDQALI